MKKQYFLLSLITLIGVFGTSSVAYAVTGAELKARYNTGQKVKILIVPGHDDQFWGTEFGDTREADVNVAIAQHLASLLASDPNLDVTLTRTQQGYTQLFKDYFATNRKAIEDFIHTQKQDTIAKLESGEITEIDGVPHNDAHPEVAIRLYGINKWANENNVDIVLHIHINDNPDRAWTKPGKYMGFTVYIPEKQFKNAAISREIGQSLFGELSKIMNKSTYAPEMAGLVEDQELIAIGSYNTRDGTSILIEYGYIYEPQWTDVAIRELVATDMAYRTYMGLEKFFNPNKIFTNRFNTSLLPHVWKGEVKYGAKNNEDILALQAALRSQNLYPGGSKTFLDCPMTGNFGPCTKAALQSFQRKYGIPATGVLGPLTRGKLNALFGK